MQERVVIFDFGSQYTQLIARRVRELNVYCEIHPYHHHVDFDENVKGVILSGSPFSVHDPESPQFDLDKLNGLPILGICFGAQYIAHHADGGKVMPSSVREYGRANLAYVNEANALTGGLSENSQVWMSHGDTIAQVPTEFEIIASTSDVAVAGYQIKDKTVYGIQFHPEVYHTTEGKKTPFKFHIRNL